MTTDRAYDASTDLLIMAGFVVLGLAILLAVWLAERKRNQE